MIDFGGKFIFGNICYGFYVLKEIKVFDGYIISYVYVKGVFVKIDSNFFKIGVLYKVVN